MNGEKWACVPSVPDYDASDLGRVRSRKGNGEPRILTPRPIGKGYLCVSLRKDGRPLTGYVHRLVLEAFIGPCPEGMECRHLDRDPTNNRLDNLCWGTMGQQYEDKKVHGTALEGSRSPRAILKESDVVEIRALWKSGAKQVDLAKRFGVCKGAIHSIIKGENWKHLGNEGPRPRSIPPLPPLKKRRVSWIRPDASRLDKETVVQIRRDWLVGMRVVRIAEKFGVSRSTVDQIVQRRTWRDIPWT